MVASNFLAKVLRIFRNFLSNSNSFKNCQIFLIYEEGNSVSFKMQPCKDVCTVSPHREMMCLFLYIDCYIDFDPQARYTVFANNDKTPMKQRKVGETQIVCRPLFIVSANLFFIVSISLQFCRWGSFWTKLKENIRPRLAAKQFSSDWMTNNE